jgi:glucose uptake protein
MLKTSKPSVSPKGVILSLVSGVLMGSFYPLLETGKVYGVGVGPYAIGFVFALGVFFSTFVFNLFFMNLPVEGEPVEILEYVRAGSFKKHILGVLGGAIWFSGAMANFVASSAEQQAKVGPAVSYALGQGATLVSVLWGLFLWNEFAGADFRVKNLLFVMVALFICGLGMVSMAPLYSR